MLLDLDPVMFQLGPFAVRWYGFLMALSVAIAFYYLRRDGLKLGYDEDFLYNVALVAVVGGVIGARIVYVATNWSMYASYPIDALRIDHGGLSFHGAVIGGSLALWWYTSRRGYSFEELVDLMVPGIAIAIALVRIGNLINGEVLGRTTELGWDRHPAQLIGSGVGVAVLIIHNVIARRRPPTGYLFWSFALYYSLLRGFVEETVRDNPLYAWGYINDVWGIGFFTLTHLITPVAVFVAWKMRQRAVALDRRPMGPKVKAGSRRR